jgi:hypothetical protein
MIKKRNSDRREIFQEFCALAVFGCFGKSKSNLEKAQSLWSAKLPPLILSIMEKDRIKAGSSTVYLLIKILLCLIDNH